MNPSPAPGLACRSSDEIASEYKGGFSLARADAGGLSARLTLPALITED
jgi:hypothetical protein